MIKADELLFNIWDELMQDDLEKETQLRKQFEKSQNWVSSLSLILGMIALVSSLASIFDIQELVEQGISLVNDNIQFDDYEELFKIFLAICAGISGSLFAALIRKKRGT